MALKDNLISIWELEEASGQALDSHGANDLDLTGGAIGTATGKVGNARDFPGTSFDNFNHVDNTDLSTGDIDFTFAAWVKVDSFAHTQVVACKGGSLGDAAELEYALFLTSGKFAFQVSDGATVTEVEATTFGAPSTGTWYFVAGWHDATNNQIGISVNGTANTASYSGGVQDTTQRLRLGGEASGSRDFDGLIDEAAFWKRVVGSTDLATIYNSGNGLAFSSWDAGGGAASTAYNLLLLGVG